MNFQNEFKKFTDFKPLSWQKRLYSEYFAAGALAGAVDMPTGLGKTAVMAIWYLALNAGARLPRRLVYVVDRRAVVDQATAVAYKIKERSGDDNLRISTLRGQHVGNREWLEDPAGGVPEPSLNGKCIPPRFAAASLKQRQVCPQSYTSCDGYSAPPASCAVILL